MTVSRVRVHPAGVFGPIITAWLVFIATPGPALAVTNIAGPSGTCSTSCSIAQGAGVLSGNNLFHSFTRFSIGNGDKVTFSAIPTTTIDNVFSRVTGGSRSYVEGTLSLEAGAGSRNFFLINPAGITFGAGAAIDVPGTFHATTADYVKFPDGKFYADAARSSTFSAATPEAFGFFGTNRGSIELSGTVLTTAGPIDFVAGDITINGGGWTQDGAGEYVERVGNGISNTSGGVRLVAVGSQANEIPVSLDGSLPVVNGILDIYNGAVIKTETSSTSTGGNITLAANQVYIDDSIVMAKTIGAGLAGNFSISTGSLAVTGGSDVGSLAETGSTGNAGNVTLSASGDVSVDASYLRADTKGSGKGGVLSLSAANLYLDNKAFVSSDTMGDGPGGSVLVTVTGLTSISNGSWVSADSYKNGEGGGVWLETGSLWIDGGTGRAGVSSDAGLDDPSWSGNGGVVVVQVKGDAQLVNGGRISTIAYGKGDAGLVLVSAKNLAIDGMDDDKTGLISIADEESHGNAGGIGVQVSGTLSMTGGGRISTTAKGVGTGSAGLIDVAAGKLVINGSGSDYDTGILSRAISDLGGDSGEINIAVTDAMTVSNGGFISTTSYSGNAGTVSINTKSLELSEGSMISSNTKSGSWGKAGTVSISAKSIDLSGESVIFSNAESTGDAGQVDIQATGRVSINSGSNISSDTYSSGNAGSVQLSAGSLLIDRQDGIITGIFSDANSGSSGDAGNVAVSVRGPVVLLNGGRISSRTEGPGSAGYVRVEAGSLRVSGWANTGFPSTIDASATDESSGRVGDVDVIVADALRLSRGGVISIRNDATVANPEEIKQTLLIVSAPKMSLSSDSAITAASSGNIPASSIYVNSTDTLYLDASRITTSANQGNGGAIYITGGHLVWLNNAQITTSVSGLAGNGGDIYVSADNLALSTGFIQANTAASSASGGNIVLKVRALMPSGGLLSVGGDTPYEFTPYVNDRNVIQAAAPDGVSGYIAITSPTIDLSGSLAGMSASILDSGGLGRNPCRTGGGSSFSLVGRGNLPLPVTGPLHWDDALSGSFLPGPQAGPFKFLPVGCLS